MLLPHQSDPCALPRSTPTEWMMDIATLRSAYLRGQTSPTEQVEHFLVQRQDPDWAGLWISRVSTDRLRQQARDLEDWRRADARIMDRLSLYGVLFAVKDNIDVAGMPTTAGCPAFAYTPAETAPVVARLLAAGAVLLGKTNLDQFATGLVGTRSPYGVPRNPFDARFIPGGSSSGSAVAVAAGLVSFALGTDTAGSGRIPAAFNNIVGLKPTRGLLSTRGVVPACRSLDCISVFALTAEDASAVFEFAACFDPDDPLARMPSGVAVPSFGSHFRFGVPPRHELEFFDDEDAPGLFAAAIGLLEEAGGRRIETSFAP